MNSIDNTTSSRHLTSLLPSNSEVAPSSAIKAKVSKIYEESIAEPQQIDLKTEAPIVQKTKKRAKRKKTTPLPENILVSVFQQTYSAMKKDHPQLPKFGSWFNDFACFSSHVNFFYTFTFHSLIQLSKLKELNNNVKSLQIIDIIEHFFSKALELDSNDAKVASYCVKFTSIKHFLNLLKCSNDESLEIKNHLIVCTDFMLLLSENERFQNILDYMFLVHSSEIFIKLELNGKDLPLEYYQSNLLHFIKIYIDILNFVKSKSHCLPKELHLAGIVQICLKKLHNTQDTLSSSKLDFTDISVAFSNLCKLSPLILNIKATLLKSVPTDKDFYSKTKFIQLFDPQIDDKNYLSSILYKLHFFNIFETNCANIFNAMTNQLKFQLNTRTLNDYFSNLLDIYEISTQLYYKGVEGLSFDPANQNPLEKVYEEFIEKNKNFIQTRTGELINLEEQLQTIQLAIQNFVIIYKYSDMIPTQASHLKNALKQAEANKLIKKFEKKFHKICFLFSEIFNKSVRLKIEKDLNKKYEKIEGYPQDDNTMERIPIRETLQEPESKDKNFSDGTAISFPNISLTSHEKIGDISKKVVENDSLSEVSDALSEDDLTLTSNKDLQDAHKTKETSKEIVHTKDCPPEIRTPRFNKLKRRELIQHLQQHGWSIVKNRGKGSHVRMQKNNITTTIPSNDIVKPGIMQSIKAAIYESWEKQKSSEASHNH